ncbi:MAG: NAD(P)-dependent oxidoreductase [Chloroflexota bacterium]
MKVAVFSAKPYDETYFNQENKPFNHELVFFESRLNAMTARLGKGFDAVCAFVNDDVDEAALKMLSERGVKTVALRCAGFNNVDLEAAAALGIAIVRVPEYSPHGVAEHAVALMFAAARKIASMDRSVRAGAFEPMDGIELAGKTLGVVGTGGIGKEMIRLGAALGMKVIAWNRSGLADGLPATSADLDHLLGQADIVSLHLALNDQTEGMIDRRRLALLKKTAILINTARGSILDEEGLIEVLRDGRIAHAALDVFEDEPIGPAHALAKLTNTTLSPHAAFMTKEASERLLKMALEILAEERAAA